MSSINIIAFRLTFFEVVSYIVRQISGKKNLTLMQYRFFYLKIYSELIFTNVDDKCQLVTGANKLKIPPIFTEKMWFQLPGYHIRNMVTKVCQNVKFGFVSGYIISLGFYRTQN